ncbi:50S ribosomal protein L10 [Candidatus Entotheonellaceae bacterium PAL068K]
MRIEKVATLHAKFAEAKGAILSDYRGLNVQQMSDLRGRLREAAVELQVVKNTLARRAVKETDLEQLGEYFVGPTSVALTVNDVVAMAKTLTEYAKGEPKLELRAGLFEGKVILPQDIAALAVLPPREVLLARLLGGMQAPVAGLVGVLHGILRQLLYALLAIREAKEG